MKDNVCLFTLVDKLRVVWEITNKCTYQCVHCCTKAGDHIIRELSTEEVKQGLRNLAISGLSSIYFSGGEPIARDDFFEILSFTSSLIESKNINFASNGKAITPEIAKKIAEHNIGTVLISLDGHDKATAQHFRGQPDSYDNAIKAMKYLSEAGVKVRLGVVIWKENYRNLEDFVRIGYENGANNVFFNWLMPVGRSKDHPEISLNQEIYPICAEQLAVLKDEYSGRINVGYHRFEVIDDSSESCKAGEKIIHITPEGKISPCSWIYKADNKMISSATIDKMTLKDILDEHNFIEFRRLIENREKNGFGPGCLAICKAFGSGYYDFDPLYKNNGLWIR